MWTVALPLSVPVTKAKSWTLNLNPYRNAHHHTLDKAKKNYKALIWNAIRKLPALPPVTITYTLFPANRRSVDVANVCSIQDKFFCDALVEAGRLPDDSFEHVVSVCYRFGGVDRSNPRVEATIEPASTEPDTVSTSSVHAGKPPSANSKENPLKISLVQTEIEEAVRAHIRSMISVREGMDINMVFSATRGEDGLTAAIDIVPAGTTSAAVAPLAAAAQPKPAERQVSSRPEARVEPTKVERAPSVFRRAAPQPAPEPEAGDEGEGEDDASSQAQAGEPEAEDAGEEVTAPKPSIFSGLKRPSNRTAEAEAAE